MSEEESHRRRRLHLEHRPRPFLDKNSPKINIHLEEVSSLTVPSYSESSLPSMFLLIH